MNEENRNVLPEDFFLSPAEQASYWGDALDAMLLEALPDSPVFEHFAAISKSREAEFLNRIWGQPDLGALLRMTGTFREEIAAALGVSDDTVEAFEYGLVPMRLREAIALCRYFHWPLAALFRDAYGTHRLTQLVSTFGIEI